MEPAAKKRRNSFFDNERFEKFYQETYKKVSEEVEALKCPTSDEEDYPTRFTAKRKFKVEQSHTIEENLAGPSTSTQEPDEAFEAATPDGEYPMGAPGTIKVEVSERTIEEVTGEDKQRNLAGPSTSTQEPDEAFEADTSDDDITMRAPGSIKVEVSESTIEEVTGEDKQENLAGPSTSTQRPDEALLTPICSEQAIDMPQTSPTKQDEVVQQAVGIKKCINILAVQCKIVFAEEGTFVPSRDLNDTVVRFMKPNNFWRKMHIVPPRSNSRFHFYLVEQDPLPATGTTNNHLAGKSHVMVAIRQAILKKDGRANIMNLARLTVSQYCSAIGLEPDMDAISWENSTANDPIACEVMCVENLPFNPFTRNGRIKSEEFWNSLPSTTTTHDSPAEEPTTKELHDHDLQVPIGDHKPLPSSTPLAEKMLLEAAVDNRHEDKPDFLVVSKFVYVIPRLTNKRSNKNRDDSQANVESTNEGSYIVSEPVSEPDEETKFQIPEVPFIRDPLQRPFSEFGNLFADNQVVEIPIETYLELTTSEIKCDESDLRNLAEVAQERN